MGFGFRKTVLPMVAVLCGAIVGTPSQARSPLPMFRGVETIAVLCGRPSDAAQREVLCTAAQAALSDLTGRDVRVGASGLSDPRTLTVLVNGHPVAGPDGPLMAITLDMVRKGHADGGLYGTAPLVLAADALVTISQPTAAKLRKFLGESVAEPFRRATPSKTDG